MDCGAYSVLAMDGKCRVSSDFEVRVVKVSPSIGGHTGYVTVYYAGCNHYHVEAAQIIGGAARLIRALEDAGESLLKSYPERVDCLRRIKEVYHEITGWHFIADPNSPLLPQFPESLDTTTKTT